MGGWERIRQRAAELGCSPAELAALAVLATGALAALGLLWLIGRPGPVGGAWPVATTSEAPATSAASEGALALSAEPVVVHVSGRVGAPGLHRLPGGARVADALEAAGGPLPDAVLDALNLARPLTDGEQIVVPGPTPPGASEPAAAAPGTAPVAGGARAGGSPPAGGDVPTGAARRPDGTLDLNRATAAELEELPRIGPVLAERIVAHRDAHGPFTSVGDLREVTGIGETILAGLAPLVGV